MRAMVRHAYGSPDLLRLEEVEKPVPRDDDVLVRVRAASLNLGDYEIMSGRPRFIRVFASIFSSKPRVAPPTPAGERRMPLGRLFEPKFKILGCDYAGTVEAVGEKVTGVAPGDDVFGLCTFGAFAEYVCVPQRGPFTRKPADVSFEEAAALPQAAFLAVQAIRDRGKVQPGQKVLIVGAGGGAGTLALQLAKLHGAEATAVDHGSKAEMMRSLGADHVVDYTQEDFTASGEQYDLIFDLIAPNSVFRSMRSVAPGGTYLAAGGSFGSFCQAILLGPLISRLGRKRVEFLMAPSPPENLEHVLELMAAGSVAPVIGHRYPLSELPEALRMVGEGRALGKVVIEL